MSYACRIVQNARFALRKMVVAITCNVVHVDTISAGCAWAIGKLMDLSTMSAVATRRILICLMIANMHKYVLQKLYCFTEEFGIIDIIYVQDC